MADDNLTSFIKTAPELLVLIYKDLAQPGVIKVGQALSTVLDLTNTILLPFKLLNEKTRITFEHNLRTYKQRIEEIPNDKICEVPPEIGIPILDKLTYVTDESISNLFINLLAKASSTDSNHLAHPSFINCINSLSPDEAIIIDYLSDKSSFPFIEVKAFKKANHITIMEIALVDMPSTLTFTNNIEAYLNNLSGLGIITTSPGEHLSDENLYAKLIEKFGNVHTFLKDTCVKAGYDKVDYGKGVFHITKYGRMFIQACTHKKR